MDADNIEAKSAAKGRGKEYRYSWVAYIKPALVILIIFAVAISLLNFAVAEKITWLIWVCAIVLLFFGAGYVIGFLESLALRVYNDDDGVWVYSGIFPWNKGINGVRWRDLEDAAYFTNFSSWLFKSYRIRIGHRFTKTSEIILNNIAHGNQFALETNRRFRQYIADHEDSADIVISRGD